MDALADEYADREVGGIFLYTNEAHPGEILPHHTSMEQKAAQAEKLREVHAKRIPLGRTGTPEDCAAAAVFFASPAAAWITGQFVDVAGGQPL